MPAANEHQTTALDLKGWGSVFREAPAQGVRQLVDDHVQQHAADGWDLVTMQVLESGYERVGVFVWRRSAP